MELHQQQMWTITSRMSEKIHGCLILIICYVIPPATFQGPPVKTYVNAALNKPVWMSTVYHAITDISKANDGNRANNIWFNCIHTGAIWTDDSPWRWWRVDLTSFYDIYYVDITNRGDCCGTRLRNFDIRVATTLNNRNTPKQEDNREKVCYHHEGSVQQGVTIKCVCTDPPVFGQYVTILMAAQHDQEYPYAKNGSPLHFCEVEVFALHVMYFDDPERKSMSHGVLGRAILRAGTQCGPSQTESSFCDFDMFCEQRPNSHQHICVIPAGQKCAGKEAFCEKSSQCDRGSCKLRAGESCVRRADLCHSSTVCINDICLIRIGSVCTEGDTNLCHVGFCNMKRCRARRLSTCTDSIFCVSGSSCQLGACRCLVGISQPNDKLCEPLAGIVEGPCLADDTCTQPKAICNTTIGQGICKCPDNYTPYREDYSCRISAGQSCTNNSDCNSGSRCEGPFGIKICKLNLGENCIGTNSRFCGEDTTCDAEHICKYKVNETCASNPTLCASGSLCEDSNGNKLCKLDIGQSSCRGSTEEDLCRTKAICDVDNVCRLRAGQSCSGNDRTNCHSDTLCDLDYTCRKKPGKSCDERNPCILGLVCEDNVCKLMSGADCTDNEAHCRKGLICDQLHRCKLQKSGNCAANPDMCLAGAVCVGNQCQCNDVVSDKGSTLCKAQAGVPGGTCSTSSGCKDPHTVCKTEKSTCACMAGYAISPRDLSCKLEPGADCSSTPQDCMAGTFCDSDNICKLKLQENCSGRYRGYCPKGTVCGINGICLLGINGNCSGFAKDGCNVGNICDAMGLCKNPINEYCSNIEENYQCMAGSYCTEKTCQCNQKISKLNSELRICVPSPKYAGGVCNPSTEGDCEDPNAVCSKDTETCQCTYPFAISWDLSCGLMVGQDCSEGSKSCVSGLICDGNMCRLTIGSPCFQSESYLCQRESICDVNSICRLALNANCYSLESNCKSGLACDYAYLCRIPISAECSPEEDMCVSGAYCAENKCVCATSEVAVEAGLLCAPAAGRIGGVCTVSTSCHDPNAICNTSYGLCSCTEGYSTDYRIYACASLTRASKSEGVSIWQMLVLCGIGAMLATFAVLIFSYRRRRSKREAAISEEERRSRAIAELSQSVEPLSQENVESGNTTESVSEIESSATSGAESSITETSVTNVSKASQESQEPH